MNTSSLIPVLIHTIRHEAKGIISIEFRAAEGGELPPFEAGSHIDLHLDNGLVRSYSLWNSPNERNRYVVGVLNDKNSRGGSKFVHENLRVGTIIKISLPRNNFKLDEIAPKSVLVAGGIGVTPIYCMFNRLRDLGKPVEMLYCARSKAEAAFSEELLGHEAMVTTHFDEDKGGPPDLKGFLAQHSADTHFYCCGPTPMLNAFEAACAELNFPNVHVERFAAAGEVEAAQDSAYRVELKRSKKTLDIPASKSLLDALLDAGVDCDYSCREGVCGACETSVIEGEPEHRDSVLTERERASNKTMMVCVSGCKGKSLVLDL